MIYHSITRDQPKAGGWAKIFTMKQNYISITDWHENNITFKLYQAGGFQPYVEKNIYLSTYKGNDTENKIQFYDLDDNAGSIKCAYIQNGSDIDVYASGGREGVPIKLEILQCPCLGKIYFYQWRGFEFPDTTNFIYPSLTTNYYDFEVVSSGSKFFKSPDYNMYYETSATRYKVSLKMSLRCINTNCKSDEFLFTIPSHFFPSWQISSDTDTINFNARYGVRKTSGVSREWDECRIEILQNGQVFARGLPSFSSGGSIDLSLDIEYRRF